MYNTLGKLVTNLRTLPPGSGLTAINVLRLLDRVEAATGSLAQATEARVQRVAMHQRIAACAEGGKIAVIESGMDCDCVRYSGHVSIIAADWREFLKHWDRTARSADGPFSLYIERPSIARNIRPQSRDLILEAFEDGHAHCIYA